SDAGSAAVDRGVIDSSSARDRSPAPRGQDEGSQAASDGVAHRPRRLDSARLLDHPAGIEQRLRMTVRYLASDALEGRGVGTEGIERAAEFIAADFQRSGLNVNHFNGSPFQQFAFNSQLRITEANRLSFE